jgi:ATP synthase protein I
MLASGNTTSTIYRMMYAQLAATLLVAGVISFFDWMVACSAMLGGLVCIVPNGFVAWQFQRVKGTAVRRLVASEAGKFVLSGCLFAAVFILVETLHAGAFFAMFIVLQPMALLTPWLVQR